MTVFDIWGVENMDTTIKYGGNIMIRHRTFKFTYNGIVSVRFPVDMRFDSESRMEGENLFLFD